MGFVATGNYIWRNLYYITIREILLKGNYHSSVAIYLFFVRDQLFSIDHWVPYAHNFLAPFIDHKEQSLGRRTSHSHRNNSFIEPAYAFGIPSFANHISEPQIFLDLRRGRSILVLLDSGSHGRLWV
jgi:hypothetical protein